MMSEYQFPSSMPEVETAGLGAKDPTSDYVSQVGYEKHQRIFPLRPGEKPATTTWEPHEQLDQLGSEQIWDEMLRRANSLPGVSEGPSLISVEGARAFFLGEELAKGPAESFIWENEFAHIHPRPDSSWHLQLPLELAVFAINAGWAEVHTTTWLGDAPANSVMLYSPRNEAELELIWELVQESYRFATGQPQAFRPEPRIAE
jgi:hypothetical protein